MGAQNRIQDDSRWGSRQASQKMVPTPTPCIPLRIEKMSSRKDMVRWWGWWCLPLWKKDHWRAWCIEAIHVHSLDHRKGRTQWCGARGLGQMLKGKMSEHAHTHSLWESHFLAFPSYLSPLLPSHLTSFFLSKSSVTPRSWGHSLLPHWNSAQCLLSVARGLLWQEAGQRNAHSLWGLLGGRSA